MTGAPSPAPFAPGDHVPVLLDAVMAALDPQPGETHVDGTFGAGGYTRALLAAGASVIAVDRDPRAVATGRALADDAATGGRLRMIEGRFGALDEAAARAGQGGQGSVDGVTLDVGVSSMQIDDPARGFSFQADGPLDMRMGGDGPTAADWLNSADETAIADALYHLGEERQSRRIARAIVAARPLSRTAELAALVRRALGHHPGAPRDPATRTFQAVRIQINGELAELSDGLIAAEALLRPGGRLAVVSFHSLEDRIVKQFLRQRGGALPTGSRHAPARVVTQAPSFARVSRAVRPDAAEIARNPRARSATLRHAVRTDAAPWGRASDGMTRRAVA